MLKYLLAPVYLLYKVWIGIVFWITLVLLYPFFRILLSRSRWYPYAFRLKKFWSVCFQVLLLCPVHASFRAKLPDPPYIIVSNHSSYLDTVFMYSIFDDYFLFIGKGELLKWPLFRRFFKTMDIPVHRENNIRAHKALHRAYDAIDRGESVALYPEGTIPGFAPKMKMFKNGAFRMAIDKQVPIVPVTWVTNYKIMLDPAKPFGRSLPHQVLVVIHPPVYPTAAGPHDLVNLRTEVFKTIDSALPPEFRKYHDH